MPTATSLSGLNFLNIGPLTTTFTAPASCSTAAHRTLIAPATDPAQYLWDAQCPWLPPADCNPSGSVVRSLVSSAEGLDPTAGLFVPYNSPGLICPFGYSTIGAAAKPNPTSISISGAFNLSNAIPTGADVAFFAPQLDVFLAALDPGETAILCCPGSYTAMDGGCYSTLPSSAFTATGACGHIIPDGDLGTVSGTWTLGQQTVTGGLMTITGTTPLSAMTTSFTPSEATSYVGVAVEGLYILVHQASDTVQASGTITASTASSTSSQSSAPRFRVIRHELSVIAAIWGLMIVLGAFFSI